MLIGGQPGAGKLYAAAQVRAHLATTVGPSVVISGEELRSYDPHCHSHALVSQTVNTQSEVGHWFARLIADSIAKGVNLQTSVHFDATLAPAPPTENAPGP